MDRERRVEREARAQARARVASLSPREAAVADLIVGGLTSAEIAERLKLSRYTVDMHRLRLRRRLGTTTSGDVVRMVLEGRAAGRPPS